MPTTHILDRPAWATLTGRQSHLATLHGSVIRMHPDYGLFAALSDESPASVADLGALVRERGPAGLVQASAVPETPGVRVVSAAPIMQMVASQVAPAWEAPFDILALGDSDAAEMLALATLTKPGPFFSRTHQLGDFIGVRVEGRLVAMAGERMRPEGYTEASAVCVHPEHRGKGYAARLLQEVTARILARGEKAFLHSYTTNLAAYELYQSLGYRARREVIYTLLEPTT